MGFKVWYLLPGLALMPVITGGMFRNNPTNQSQIVVQRSEEIDQAEQALAQTYQATQQQLESMPAELMGSRLDVMLSADLQARLDADKNAMIALLSATADQFLQEARAANQSDGVSIVNHLTQKCYWIASNSADKAIQSGVQQYAVNAENRETIRASLTDSYACALALQAASRGESTVVHQPLNPGIWGDQASYYSQVNAAQIAATQPTEIPPLGGDDSEVAKNEK